MTHTDITLTLHKVLRTYVVNMLTALIELELSQSFFEEIL